MSDLTLGAWRNGLSDKSAEYLADVETRASKGFRLAPIEDTVVDMANLLDANDQLFEEFANSETAEAIFHYADEDVEFSITGTTFTLVTES